MIEVLKPVRNKPFLPSCYLGGGEREMVSACLESLNWSNFRAGIGSWKARELLGLTSAEAVTYGPDQVPFLGGCQVRALEARYAADHASAFAVSANSATSALVMALAALDLGLGDEVLVPCMSFHASATAIVQAHATPVFTEVKPDTLCIDPLDMEAKINARTKAIIAVHLSGNTADMDAILAIAKKHGLWVLEDCAQAPGVRYHHRPVGSLGHVGIFSLTQTKNICSGEGGVLVTNNERIACKARLIRNHGEAIAETDWSDDELVNIVGMNFRLTELQAALALAQYAQLEDRNRMRRENAAHLYARLEDCPELIAQKPEHGALYTCFIAKWRYLPQPGMPDRDALVAAMAEQGIPLIAGYQRLLHELPLYTRRIAFARGLPFQDAALPRYGTGTCPLSEQVNRQLIWFSFIHPPQTRADMDDVAEAFGRVLGRR